MIAENEDRPNRTKAKPLPPIDYLRQLFVVDPTSPSGLRWKVKLIGSRGVGHAAGSAVEQKPGRFYWRIRVQGIKIWAHRIVWAVFHGSDPCGYQIDHINGDGLDNRIENLRLATCQQNCRNQGKRTTNKSGVKGVYFNRQTGRFRASIMVNYRSFNLGEYHTLEEAAAARKAAEIKYFGEFNPRPV